MKLKGDGLQLTVGGCKISSTSIGIYTSNVDLIEAKPDGGHHPISAYGIVPVYFVLAPVLVRWIEREKDEEDRIEWSNSRS